MITARIPSVRRPATRRCPTARVTGHPIVTIDYLRAHLRYEDGQLIWREDGPHRRPCAGKPIRYVLRRGYARIRIKRRNLYAHRVIWAIIHGEWPKCQIDHINRDRLDNRVENLRDVSAEENARNRADVNPALNLPLTGWITRARDKWMAFIKKDGRRIYLGVYRTQEEAEAARTAAARLLNTLSPTVAAPHLLTSTLAT